ncbi:MAG: hypothetical protein ACLGIB_09130 [Actinomycetota bacterium]
MRRRTRALLLVSVPVVLSVVAAAIQTLNGHNVLRDSEALGALAFIGFGIVGGVVLAATPGHRMGRVFYGAGLLSVVTWATDNYARYSVDQNLDLPGELLAAWIQNWTWFLPIGMIFTVGLLLFPNGELPGRRWRPLYRLSAISLGALTFAFMLHDEPLDGFRGMDNPTGVVPEGTPFAGISFALVVACALGSVAALAWRFKASRGTERQQMKWVVYAVAMMVLVNLVLPAVGAETSERATDLLFGASTLLFPIACGVAILRYRLYDIDLLVNKTLVYGALTAVLALAYLMAVVGLQRVLAPVAADSDLAVAGSTLFVAGLFRPLRSWLQGFIDKRFYRNRYDAAATLEVFSAHLRDEIDLHALKTELVAVAVSTFQPAHAHLWLRQGRTQ